MLKRIKDILRKLVLICLIIIPNTVFAFSSEYESINNQDFTLSDNASGVEFTQVSYTNWSNMDYPVFGLGGLVYNHNYYDIKFNVTANFYDASYNLVAVTTTSQNVTAQEVNSYSHLNSTDEIYPGYTVDDIVYYKMTVDVINNQSVSPNTTSQFSNYEYYLDSYDINIIVNENNTFDITETITAKFNVHKHGIYRTIPLRNKVTRTDGTTTNNRATVSNVSVDHEYTTSKANGFYKIQIGSPDYTSIGNQTYTIKYQYNIGKDPLKEIDELYYNLIGTEWDTAINNITFTITMPKTFDANTIGFSSGDKGSTDNSLIDYTINGTQIIGKYHGHLTAGQALTVRLELPEGYFVGAGFTVSSSTYLMYLIPLIVLVISFIIWYTHGRDNQVIETVEFYPPSGFNSLEVGVLYKGQADTDAVTSLLIYLANKGYLKIIETQEKSLFSKVNGFKIIKLKDYDGNNANEQEFINGLFRNGKTEVRPLDLYNKFYRTTDKILKNINNKENKNMIFEKQGTKLSIAIIFLLIISLVTTIAIPTLEYSGIAELLFTLVLILFYTPFFCVIFFVKMPIPTKIFTSCFITIHFLIFFSTQPIATAMISEFTYLVGVIFGLLCASGTIICYRLMPKRTPYGTEMLGKLRGFKTFLETVEKDKLEAMVFQDPSYFYHILPYTYVLGVSDKWIKKFETITLQAPTWYDSPTGFNTRNFGHFINTTMSTAKTSMRSSSSRSSGSGGSSGGGSSGGGSGGGGGGSW